ncbi:MAG TPA: ABC transporter ATP-binding protein [Anaerolineaceae bacterium]|nr:ABC transporter ATP-binding protein [Anaerolineaceae bacterium]
MTQAFIEVKDLRKIYQMGETQVKALDGVSIEVPQGAFVVLMGPSGSGKSTMLYLIGGLDTPTSGSITIDGEAIEKMDENTLAVFRREKLGFIFQSFNLISSMTAEDNVSFPLRFGGVGRKERHERAQKLLTMVGIGNRMGHKPTELSGGQQQRVAVSRALINDPQLILADEPTGNLDTTSGMAIMQLLSDLNKGGKTIIVATHDPRMLNFASEVVHLIDGRRVSETEYHQKIQQLG